MVGLAACLRERSVSGRGRTVETVGGCTCFSFYVSTRCSRYSKTCTTGYYGLLLQNYSPQSHSLALKIFHGFKSGWFSQMTEIPRGRQAPSSDRWPIPTPGLGLNSLGVQPIMNCGRLDRVCVLKLVAEPSTAWTTIPAGLSTDEGRTVHRFVLHNLTNKWSVSLRVPAGSPRLSSFTRSPGV